MAQVTQVGARVASKPSFKARFQESVRYAKQWRSHYVFMAPFITLFTIFTIIPVLSSIYLSFTYFNVLQPPKWIGWSNYALLFLEDDIFLIALKNTLVFAIITGPVSFFMQFALAWLINSLKYRTAYTLAFYAPSITSGLVMSNIWKILFSSDMYGYLNYFLTRIGAITQPVLWLQDVDTMMPIVILVSLWMSMGAGFLSFLAGLQNMNEELYEAGRMDGIRNRLQEVWYITLPMMKPQLLFGAVMAVVRALEVSSVAISLTGLPSPLYATHTIMTHLQDYAFIRFEMGYASAISVVLFVMMFSLSRFFMRVLSTKDEY